MKREDVIRIAKESGAWEYFEIYEDNRFDVPALERFAAAIRSATKEEDAKLLDAAAGRLLSPKRTNEMDRKTASVLLHHASDIRASK